MMKYFLTAVLGISMAFAFASPSLAVSQELRNNITGGAQQAAQGVFDTDFTGEEQLSVLYQELLNTILGILGLAAVILIVYAGYMWMSAGGNSGQIDKAKTIIQRVVIGMVVVSLAYGIVSFALTSFQSDEPADNPQNTSASNND